MFENFFRKSCRLWVNAEKHGTAGKATDDNIIRCRRNAWWLNLQKHTLMINNAYSFSTTNMVTRTNVFFLMHFDELFISEL
jgi:hypothetical protein